MKFISSAKNYKSETDISDYTPEKAEHILGYHASFPQYKETGLVELKCFAKENGIKNVYLKDESTRFDLNAFKVLGGSYAIGRLLSEKYGLDKSSFTYNDFMKPEIKEKLRDETFISATDGNHGRGVAATAQMLGCKAHIYMVQGTADERLANVRKTGAHAEILDMNYDDCVRFSTALAKKNGWTLVQDTAFGDYRTVPSYIMQGYLTMGLEAYRQLDGVIPTHIFLQAGVGSFAAAMTALFTNLYSGNKPKIIVVESEKADCILRTAEADDNTLHCVTGKLDTIMAGLSCGEPSELAWPILRDYADAFISIPDYCAENAIRKLARPCGTDKPVVAGESGASGFAALLDILTDPDNEGVKNELNIGKDSVVLVFSTEGATDRENYDKILSSGD